MLQTQVLETDIHFEEATRRGRGAQHGSPSEGAGDTVAGFARSPVRVALVVALCGALVACGDSDDGGSPTTVDDGASDDSDGPTDPNAVQLDPPAAGRGVQLKMVTRVPAGEDVEHCQFVQLGDEELIVNHDEARFAGGSHHVLVYTTTYDEIPTRNLYGDAFDTSKPFDCSIGVAGFWDVTGLISASQNGSGASSVAFPEGVGMRVPGGSVLLINAHYINARESEIEPEIRINLHAIGEDELEQEGGLLFWYHPFLKVPAGTSSVARAGCDVPEDIQIVNAQSHMHRLGVGYTAELFDPKGAAELIYEGAVWEDVPVETYSPMLQVRAGSRIEWQCEYDNRSERDVFQGPRSSDEMCMFIGSYFPRNDDLSWCRRNGESFMGAHWMIGEGDKNCAESMECIISAIDELPGEPETRGPDAVSTAITECMVQSDPAVSDVLSAVVGCTGSAEEGKELDTCASEIAACQKR